MAETHVDRILRMLRMAIRLLGLSNREIERRLGWTPSYMTRILKGNIELKVEHLVAIAGAMGLSPREFFLFAFPDRGEPSSEAAVKLVDFVEDFRPSAARKPDPQGLTQEDLDQRIEAALQGFFAKMATKGK